MVRWRWWINYSKIRRCSAWCHCSQYRIVLHVISDKKWENDKYCKSFQSLFSLDFFCIKIKKKVEIQDVELFRNENTFKFMISTSVITLTVQIPYHVANFWQLWKIIIGIGNLNNGKLRLEIFMIFEVKTLTFFDNFQANESHRL